MRIKKSISGQLFQYCQTESQVFHELHKSVIISTSIDQANYLDKEAICRIKQLRKENAKKYYAK